MSVQSQQGTAAPALSREEQRSGSIPATPDSSEKLKGDGRHVLIYLSMSWFIRRRTVTVPCGEVHAGRFPCPAAEHPQHGKFRL